MIIIWVILADLVIISAFFLALKSMNDYKEKPENFKVEYALFLIKNPEAFNKELLGKLHKLMLKKRFIFSIEKLFKGGKQALVIYGPKVVLDQLSAELSLMELEDYTTNLGESQVSISQMPISVVEKINSLEIDQDEQLWWQLVLQPAGRNIIEKIYIVMQRAFSSSYQLIQRRIKKAPVVEIASVISKERFYGALTTVIVSNDPKRKEELFNLLPLGIPSRYSSNHKLQIYKERSLPLSLGLQAVLSPERIEQIIS